MWQSTQDHWASARPDISGSVAPGESAHSWAVLRGLTSADGGMVAAATTSLPERAEKGRNYDYRYAWIRDQCYAGIAAATLDAPDLLDAAVGFVTDRVLTDGKHLRPVYQVDGSEVPPERSIPLRGYPGAPVGAGNHARSQFQLDTLGEALLLLATADGAGRLDNRRTARHRDVGAPGPGPGRMSRGGHLGAGRQALGPLKADVRRRPESRRYLPSREQVDRHLGRCGQ